MTEELIRIDRSPQRTAALSGIKAAVDLLESFVNSDSMRAFDLTYPQPTISARWNLRGYETDIDLAALNDSIRTLNQRGTGSLHVSYQGTGYTTLSYGFVRVYDNPYDDKVFRFAATIDVATINHDRFVTLWENHTEDPDAQRLILSTLKFIDSLEYITGYYHQPDQRVWLADLCV